MALMPLALPPGLYRNGTGYQSKGRWFDSNLVRFFQGTIQPDGGWRVKSTSTITGKGRAIVSWHDNGGLTWSAIGTESNLYAMTRGGVVSDITPLSFTTGRADAVAEGGFGDGNYGVGVYGQPIPDSSGIQDASVWSLDTFGQYLLGVMSDDGKIYQWTLNTASAAAVISAAPTCVALLVTNEQIVMALGASNDPRKVSWSDAGDNTAWTPSTTNQAGSDELTTNGRLMQGLRVAAGNLLFTDLDVHNAVYQANQFVYGFTVVGHGCGAISRNCAAQVDAAAATYGAQAVWMSDNGFFIFNGYVLPLPCDVWDFVFNNLNTLQKSKITSERDPHFGEITWRYPSKSSLEVDSYVRWNYRENHWAVGSLVRLSGIEAGVNSPFPMRVGSDGNIYEHEVGFAYGGATPFLESGPFELGNGASVQYATQLMPDDVTVGDVSATFFTKFEPDDTELTYGPYALSKLTDIRFGGRQIRVRYDGVTLDSWRVGVPRLEVVAGGAR